MKSSYICSYVIPYTHSTNNLKILRNMLSILGKDPRIQKIVVETGKTPIIKDIDLKSDYLFVESDVWNVGWLFNCGFRLSKSDNLFFGTFEYLPRLDIIHSLLAKQDNRECVYLQGKLIKLNKEQTLRREFSPVFPGKKQSHEGIVYYTRDGFNKVGRWDENLTNKHLYELQDRKNRMITKLGVVDDVPVIKGRVDLPEVRNSIESNKKKHFNRIIEVSDQTLRSYIINQIKRSSNYNKYRSISIMDK